MPEPIKVALISLGCPKNQVDSEVLLAHLGSPAITLVSEPETADVVVVNTCAFIEDAREEAVETLLAMVALKQEGRLKGVIGVGCLTQLHGREIREALPEVDAFLPITDYTGVAGVIAKVAAGREVGVAECGGAAKGERSDLERVVLSPGSYAYLRISEGCNHRCSFCAIPAIRGPLRSKPLEVLLEEARRLAAAGTRELILVAEDSTVWGQDLGGGAPRLPELLAGLAGVAGIAWVRVMYGYPWTLTEAALEAMRDLPQVVPYLDLPVQHTDPDVLEAMGRGGAKGKLESLLHRIREVVPGIALRTSILVGHPRETQRRFEGLLTFLEAFRFERLGAFTFSPEEGTPAATMGGRPSRRVAQERWERVMALQRELVFARNESLVGGEMEVLIDREDEAGLYTGRTFADAPEVDCQVLVRSAEVLRSGDLMRVAVTGFAEYDLEGEVIAG